MREQDGKEREGEREDEGQRKKVLYQVYIYYYLGLSLQ